MSWVTLFWQKLEGRLVAQVIAAVWANLMDFLLLRLQVLP